MMAYMVQKTGKKLYQCVYCASPQYGWAVAHFAAYNGHLEMVQELLERFNCEADKKDKVNMEWIYH